MAEGYEWIFLACYASMVVGGLMFLREVYVMVLEHRERNTRPKGRRPPYRPRYPVRSRRSARS
jgi:hypothetical protein